RNIAAAVDIHLDVALCRGYGRGALVLLDERDFVQVSVGAMHPDIEADGLAGIRLRDDEAVRLHAAIDGRRVRAHQPALALRPGRRSRGKFPGARDSLVED